MHTARPSSSSSSPSATSSPGPQEVRLVTDLPQADDQVGQPAVHLGHQVEQPGPAGPEHLGPAQR